MELTNTVYGLTVTVPCDEEEEVCEHLFDQDYSISDVVTKRGRSVIEAVHNEEIRRQEHEAESKAMLEAERRAERALDRGKW